MSACALYLAMNTGAGAADGMCARRAFGIGFAAAAVLAIVFIFSNSLQPAEISGAVSGGMLRVINTWLESHGLVAISEQLLRKCAHLCEFGLLGVLLTAATFLLSTGDAKLLLPPSLSTAIATAVAVCDETVQYFVPGRACLATDMLIDGIGAALGATAVSLIFALHARRCWRKEPRHDFDRAPDREHKNKATRRKE